VPVERREWRRDRSSRKNRIVKKKSGDLGSGGKRKKWRGHQFFWRQFFLELNFIGLVPYGFQSCCRETLPPRIFLPSNKEKGRAWWALQLFVPYEFCKILGNKNFPTFLE
jgi:hypothetical protein